MAEFPALPFFTDSYIADTRHLTAAQHGAYMLLLMTAWRMPDCKLPDDDVFLSRCAAMDIRTWKKNKPIVMSFWRQDDQQKWCQGRLLDVRNFADNERRRNSEAGKASALKRKNRDSTPLATKTQPNSNLQSNPNPIDINPHTPLNDSQPVDNSLGIESKDFGKKADPHPPSIYRNIELLLTDKAMERAKAAAPGWDIYGLIREYNERFCTQPMPSNPIGAFIAWCGKRTAGKPP